MFSDDALILPAAPVAPSRSPFPVVGTIVPVIGGVALWAVLGSPFALLFALLGPFVALGGLVDQVRGARRRRARSESDYAGALADLESTVLERHAQERRELWARHPDVAASVSRVEDIWRGPTPGQHELVVGSGTRPSVLRVTGDTSRPESERLRRAVARLAEAPVTVDWRSGIAVRGERALALSVLRALVLQLCLAYPPDALQIVGTTGPDAGWISGLPHHRSPEDGHVDDADVRVVVGTAGSGRALAGVLFTWGSPTSVIDPRCAVVLDVREPEHAILAMGTERVELAIEAVSDTQARAVARLLTARAASLYGATEAEEPISLADVTEAPGVGGEGGLSVALGRDGDRDVLVDLVRDGPHAVVTGITGSGKSELLSTWIAALCTAYSTRDVAFLLADFKGGMTFDALAVLPHVTGVITDLDGGSAERAIASLRAELRRREHELARHGARDIADPRVALPRLIIVVDEFAALVAEHDGLHRIFADVAARGRALGMHLILGSQRVAGGMNDALLANCPLRIALRAADAADSRAVLGDDAAWRLPGGAAGRGRALVKRAGDRAPQSVRIARTTTAELTALALATEEQGPIRSPWLPALPRQLPLEELRERSDDSAAILLALADDPARQRQFPIALAETGGLVVIGRAGSGKSSVVTLIAAQAPDAVVVSRDLESAWDTLTTADESRLWLVDDADDLLARFPPDHAVAAAECLDRVARAGRLVVTARSASGRLGRITDPFSQRALLALSSRAEHIGAGGEGTAFRPDLPPGRGHLAGREVQFAKSEAHPRTEPADPVRWRPDILTGVVTRRTETIAAALRLAHPDVGDVRLLREFPAASRLRALVSDAPPGLILVGDGEDWLARWGLLQELRARHPLVVDADCAAELRTVAGERNLPPYIRPGAGRAWLCTPDAAPERVSLVAAPN